MPKIVDHEARRRLIIESVWALIGRRGLPGVTMRELAAEAGFANGGLAPYFRDKDEILFAAFQYACDATERRLGPVVTESSGTTALRALCHELMPLDDTRLLEARVVIAFCDRAVYDRRMSSAYEATTNRWRTLMHDCLTQARSLGELTTAVPDELIVETLSAVVLGFQANAVLTPAATTPARQAEVVDALLESYA
ncbi:TetR/AcrR family transcriptional regulator [Streptomyces ipomoeae]|uniref:TetR/AcrR family transcriptional regulator n=1 Tax=Streptomyces ipomoeae TaxID=103232 RepID=UPI0011470044|nr:TetR/AcrR family transcriptional regulator [Streptomyces ipomoeae]MDX2937834.1 TetR/AcrR family transcriptional regulator [Streptomyces ipomoeae]TQE27454.1 TetR family transcriptional regulator [Streptomyces ipomoeae]